MKALSIKNLTKQYENGLIALKGINLEVDVGEFFALLGPNGAGKSTAIGIMTSLVIKSSGTVSIFGHDIEKNSTMAKTFIGVVPQEFNFNMFENVIDIVVNQAGFYGITRKEAFLRAEHYLGQLGLWDKRYFAARMLSGGMKRRLMIARALIHEPRMLILDEPTAGVDIELRRSMWQFLSDINARGTTIILTTHNLEEAESLCRRVAIIDKGNIIVDTTVKKLLSQLSIETIILDLKHRLLSPPEIPHSDTECIDDTTLAVTFSPNKITINQIFEYLTAKNIEVLSMRNKANRLEELFVRLIEEHP